MGDIVPRNEKDDDKPGSTTVVRCVCVYLCCNQEHGAAKKVAGRFMASKDKFASTRMGGIFTGLGWNRFSGRDSSMRSE